MTNSFVEAYHALSIEHDRVWRRKILHPFANITNDRLYGDEHPLLELYRRITNSDFFSLTIRNLNNDTRLTPMAQ
jgi:hypothetical protein